MTVAHSFGSLRRQFPQTAEAFSRFPDGGRAAFLHLHHLDQTYFRPRELAAETTGSPPAPIGEFDVVLAGGGLSLIYAAFLSMRGLRVAVFDRRQIGCGHREWNISRKELLPLYQSGLFSEEEVRRLVLMQYRTGICRFGDGDSYAVSGVLDCVVDAETLLHALCDRCERQGVTMLPFRSLVGYELVPGGVEVTVRSTQGAAHEERLRARLLIDGLGAVSPHARFDLCCPTVGGVMDDLAIGSGPLEMDPEVGEILVTTEGVEEQRQHIWEGFPTVSASGDPKATRRMTIYLCLPANRLATHGRWLRLIVGLALEATARFLARMIGLTVQVTWTMPGGQQILTLVGVTLLVLGWSWSVREHRKTARLVDMPLQPVWHDIAATGVALAFLAVLVTLVTGLVM